MNIDPATAQVVAKLVWLAVVFVSAFGLGLMYADNRTMRELRRISEMPQDWIGR